MTRRQASQKKGEIDSTAAGSEEVTNLNRREALAKLGRYAAAGYIAPAMVTLLVSKKASAASGPPPPPPPT